jgi:WD40 repeat protein
MLFSPHLPLNTAIKFHPSGRLLMSGGDDKNLRFFRIDGDKNEKQLSKSDS